MAIRKAAPPKTLHRVGRIADPMALAPKHILKTIEPGRFDDPKFSYRVRYVAEELVTSFLEVTAHFRPDVDLLAKLQAMDSDEPPRTGNKGTLTRGWVAGRAKVELAVETSKEFVDLRDAETRGILREQFARSLKRLKLKDMDLSAVSGPHRTLTREISRWAFEEGYAGIAYASRHDGKTCWAIFERRGVTVEATRMAQRVSPTDPALLEAMTIHRLELQPESPPKKRKPSGKGAIVIVNPGPAGPKHVRIVRSVHPGIKLVRMSEK